MHEFDDRRKFQRLSTGPDYGVRFQVQGRCVEKGQLQNLSAGGCGLQVPMTDMGDLEMGSTVEALFLDHPDLPWVPLEGIVVRVMGKVPGKTTGYALVGLEFTRITRFIQVLINDHVLGELLEV